MDSDMVVNEKTAARNDNRQEGRAEAEGGAGTSDGTNVATGDIGICPVGQGAVTDAVHGACAGCYFVCHCVLHWYVRTAGAFRAVFFGSFAAFLLALGRVRGMEKKFGFLAESDSRAGKPGDGGDGATGRQLLQPEPRRLLFRYELAQMLCENGMFVSFLLGMTSGLPHKPQRAPG